VLEVERGGARVSVPDSWRRRRWFVSAWLLTGCR